MNQDFEITIGSKVFLKGPEMEGVVTGIMQEQDGLQYRVVYWVEGVRRCEWLYGFEIGRTTVKA